MQKTSKPTYKKITSLTKLRKTIENGHTEFKLLLAGGATYSRKTITLTKTKFKIINHIDNTKQLLTEEQILDPNYTNIGIGIKRKALVYKE